MYIHGTILIIHELYKRTELSRFAGGIVSGTPVNVYRSNPTQKFTISVLFVSIAANLPFFLLSISRQLHSTFNTQDGDLYTLYLFAC